MSRSLRLYTAAWSLCLALPLSACIGFGRLAEDRADRAAAQALNRQRDNIFALQNTATASEVITAADGYLAEVPRDDVVWAIVGNAQREAGNLDQAEVAYRRAISVNSDNVVALLGQGLVAQDRGRLAEAAALFRDVLTRRPDSADAYMGLSVIALLRREDRVALNYAETAFDLDSDNPVTAANLAIVFHYNGLEARRDDMVVTASRLGYDKLDTLAQIFAGTLTVR